MSFSADEPVSEDEQLFRAVHPKQWKDRDDRPSSACFKQTGGPSVDRDGGRDLDEIVSALDEIKGSEYGVSEVDAGFCISGTDVHVEAEPLEVNEYHATIYRSSDCERAPNGRQARELAEECTTHRRPEAP